MTSALLAVKDKGSEGSAVRSLDGCKHEDWLNTHAPPPTTITQLLPERARAAPRTPARSLRQVDAYEKKKKAHKEAVLAATKLHDMPLLPKLLLFGGKASPLYAAARSLLVHTRISLIATIRRSLIRHTPSGVPAPLGLHLDE